MKNTPVCRSCACDAKQDKQIVRAEYVFGGKDSHKFWECQDCGLVYLYPVPSQEEENKFYAQEFEKFMETRTGGDRDWSGPEKHIQTNQDQVTRRWKFLKDDLKTGKSVLEIGCSSGFMMDSFKEHGLETVGIEPSGGFDDFLAKRGHEVYRTVEELKTKQPSKKFDFIVHFFVLEHIRDTVDFLQTQLDLLKPGGKIIAEVPCVNDPLTSLYNIPAFEKFYWSIAHHYYFNPKSLSPIVEKLDCSYKFVPEQRYDLSNHTTWMQTGKPGGQGKYNPVFSKETLENYANDLKEKWLCDTFFLYITKPL